MKRILLGFSLVVSSLTFAQTIELREHDETQLINDTQLTKVVYATPANQYDLKIDITNASGSDKTYNVKRYDNSITNGIREQLCFFIYCYSAEKDPVEDLNYVNHYPTWVMDHAADVMIADGATNTSFKHSFEPQEIAGISTMTFVVYDVNNPTDSASFEVEFNHQSTVGLESNDIAASFEVYPNPANDILNIDFANVSNGSTIELMNVLGQQVESIEIKNEGSQSIDVSDFESGIYFLAVRDRKNNIVLTEKVNIR